MRCQHCGAPMSIRDAEDARDEGYRLGDLCPDCIDILVLGGELEPSDCYGRDTDGPGHRCFV